MNNDLCVILVISPNMAGLCHEERLAVGAPIEFSCQVAQVRFSLYRVKSLVSTYKCFNFAFTLLPETQNIKDARSRVLTMSTKSEIGMVYDGIDVWFSFTFRNKGHEAYSTSISYTVITHVAVLVSRKHSFLHLPFTVSNYSRKIANRYLSVIKLVTN